MPISLLIVLTGVFASGALISGSVATLALARNAPERKRLRKLATPAPSTDRVERIELSETPSPALKRFFSVLPASPGELSRMRRRLASAGYHEYAAVVVYSSARIIMPV